MAHISPNQRSFSFSIKLLSDTLLRFAGNSVQSHISFFLYLYVLLYSLKSKQFFRKEAKVETYKEYRLLINSLT